jgi:hypothetical protein
MDPCKLRLNLIIITYIDLQRSGGRARQSATDLRLLHPLTVRPSSRGVSTDVISAENLHAFGAKHITKGLGRITEGIMTKGEGSYVVYDDGRRMLDFTCGIGVTSLGRLTMVSSLRHLSTTTLPTSYVNATIFGSWPDLTIFAALCDCYRPLIIQSSHL